MLKIAVTSVEQEIRYGSSFDYPNFRSVEIRGHVMDPCSYGEIRGLLDTHVVLVPQGQVDAERDRLWCEALAEVLGTDTVKMEAVLTAFNSRRPD